jgi:hypothetical protein
MVTRTNRETVTFSNPFSLEGVGRILPAGNYEVVTDEEMIEGLSFPVYRRIATMMLVPTKTSTVEMLSVDPLNLEDAKKRDLVSAALQPGMISAKGQ